MASGDGCSPSCTIEAGYSCSGAPSTCTETCGDTIVVGSEACDDGNVSATDGCSPTCDIETGWACSGTPSMCAPICGDALVTGPEQCDDGDTLPGDGCSATCTVEPGYGCTIGNPSTCTETCGDALVVGDEQCDDGNLLADDGCDAACSPEIGWTCSGEPSTCAPVCGDGLERGTEECDDTNIDSGDGCSSACTLESGWTCPVEGAPCTSVCGDGLTVGPEECDDGNTGSSDGCSSTCGAEAGWNCSGSPSSCASICGDSLVVGGEACDQGVANGTAGSCCSASCGLEPSSKVCRPAADVCDLEETCDGATPLCPIDVVKPDGDADAVCDEIDNCPGVANGGQADADGDSAGDACDVCTNDAADDADADGFCADAGFLPPKIGDDDNCPGAANPGQEDLDGDGDGNLCDGEDTDGLSIRKLQVRTPARPSSDVWSAQAEMSTGATPAFLAEVDDDGIVVSLRNASVAVDTLSFAGSDCKRSGPNKGNLRCRTAAGDQLRLTQRPAPSFFKVIVKAKKRALAAAALASPPFGFVVTSPVSIDRVDTIASCTATPPGSVKCIELP